MSNSSEVDTSGGSFLQDIEVFLRVCVGTATPTINDLMTFEAGTVLPLDRKISDEVRLFVGDKLFATGLLEEEPGSEDGRLQVRIVELDQRKKN